MDPFVTSSLISTGANLLGGLMGGKSKRGPDLMDMASHQAYLDKNRFKWIMAGAKKAGIHPTVALGLPPVSPTVGSVGGGDVGMDSSILPELGQGAARAYEAYATKDQRAMQDVLSKLAVERGQLENESLRSDIALKRSSLAPAFPNPALPPMIPGQGDTRYPEQARMGMGYGDTAPIMRKARDPNGDYIRVYNDDLGDNEILQALSAFAVTLPDMAANAGQRTGRYLRRKFDNWRSGNAD